MLAERMKTGQYGMPITHSLYAAIAEWAAAQGLHLRTEEVDDWRIYRIGDDLIRIRLDEIAAE